MLLGFNKLSVFSFTENCDSKIYNIYVNGGLLVDVPKKYHVFGSTDFRFVYVADAEIQLVGTNKIRPNETNVF